MEEKNQHTGRHMAVAGTVRSPGGTLWFPLEEQERDLLKPRERRDFFFFL